MGFKSAKVKVLECLNSGCILHEERNNVDIKNLLATGVVSTTEVSRIIGVSRGNSYSCSPHHFDSNVEVHILNMKVSGVNWYIKWYFLDPDSVFISVHN